MQARPRVLFVDDEPHLLAGLRRSLHTLRVGWELSFAESGAQALELLAAQPCDAVVSDMRMPGMDGAQLLGEVQRLHPATVRIVLSGEAERSAVLGAAAATHQFLAKPCEAEAIVAVIERALDVRRTLTDPALRELIGGVSHLPALPAIYHELAQATARPDCTVETVAAILAKDVATCVEVLKLTNSAFFGIPRRIDSVAQAVSMLGLDIIQALVVTGSAFRTASPAPGLDQQGLQRRALQRTAVVRRVAATEHWPVPDTSSVALAAMLLDVGALVLARGRPEVTAEFRRVLAQDDVLATDPTARRDLQRELFGCSVPEASAYLLGLWGFSQRVVHMVAGQPITPTDSGVRADDLLLTLVEHRVLTPGAALSTRFTSALADNPAAAQLQAWTTACDQVLAGQAAELDPVG